MKSHHLISFIMIEDSYERLWASSCNQNLEQPGWLIFSSWSFQPCFMHMHISCPGNTVLLNHTKNKEIMRWRKSCFSRNSLIDLKAYLHVYYTCDHTTLLLITCRNWQIVLWEEMRRWHTELHSWSWDPSYRSFY